MGNNHKMKKLICKFKTFRYAQIGVVSFGSDCPSQGVYARVTKIKHWIQFIAGGALDTNCNQEIPWTPGLYSLYSLVIMYNFEMRFLFPFISKNRLSV